MQRHQSAEVVEPLVYTKAQLTRILGLSKSTIDNMRREGTFPQAIVLGGRKVGWHVETIKEWIAKRPMAKSIYD